MAGGRPLLFETKEKLEEAINKYFEDCQKREKPPTIAGLAFWLDVDRHTIYNYEKRDEFFHTIKRVRNRIMAILEEELMVKGTGGQIFLAKNYGYTDKQEHDINANVREIKVKLPDDLDD